MKKLQKGTKVKTTKKCEIKDYEAERLFIKNRKNTTDSVVDSPIRLINNKLWLVKHSNSKLVNGISVGFYGVYHEDELEIVYDNLPLSD